MPRSSDLAIRRLGVAVLASAFYDAAGLGRRDFNGKVKGSGARTVDEVADEAYAWLTTPSERLDFWAECAGLDMATVIAGADAAVAYAKRTSRFQFGRASGRRVRR